jgi:NIMA (never in mitosis gene a)-related kinase
MDFVGDPLSKYKEIRCVHKGEGRAAYLCQTLDDNSLVVMKKISIRNVSRQEQEEAIREAEILKILKHPNIIQFRDFFVVKREYICIVMDYADAGDLASKIKQTETYFSETQILDWFAQIVLALKHMHDRKIVHRDIKCSNIFLTSMNIVKLGDFGISSFLSHTNDFLKSFAGTYFYLSPEIINNQPYNYKTDVWSLGVVLYELCTLHPPFTTIKNDKKILEAKIKSGNFKDIPLIYSQELKNLVSSLLTVAHTKRPSVKEILQLPIIKNRIRNFLTEIQYADEFSHTVLHKVKFNTAQNNLTSPFNYSSNEKSEDIGILNPKPKLAIEDPQVKPALFSGADNQKPPQKSPYSQNGYFSPFMNDKANNPFSRQILPDTSPSLIQNKLPNLKKPNPFSQADNNSSNLQRIQEELDNLLRKNKQSNFEEQLRAKSRISPVNNLYKDAKQLKIDHQKNLFKKNYSEPEVEMQQIANFPVKVLPDKQIRHLKKHLSIQEGLISEEKKINQRKGAIKSGDSSEERVNKEKRKQFYNKVEFLKKELKDVETKSNEEMVVPSSIENFDNDENPIPQLSKQKIRSMSGTDCILNPDDPNNDVNNTHTSIVLKDEIKIIMIQKDQKEYEELLNLYRNVLEELEEPTFRTSALEIASLSENQMDYNDLLKSIYTDVINDEENDTLKDLKLYLDSEEIRNLDKLENKFGQVIYAKFLIDSVKPF